MAEQREDEIAMAIEARGLPDQRQDAVGRRQREQRVDVGVAHPLRHEAQRQLRRELRLKPPPPAASYSRNAPPTDRSPPAAIQHFRRHRR